MMTKTKSGPKASNADMDNPKRCIGCGGALSYYDIECSNPWVDSETCELCCINHARRHAGLKALKSLPTVPVDENAGVRQEYVANDGSVMAAVDRLEDLFGY